MKSRRIRAGIFLCFMFQLIGQIPIAEDVTFLSPNKKVTKEVGLKGATGKSQSYCAIASGNRFIFIRCAEYHPLGIPRRIAGSTFEN